MDKHVKHMFTLLLMILLLLPSVMSSSTEESTIVLDLFYSESCGSCDFFKQLIINEYLKNESYSEFLTVNIKDVDNQEYYEEWNEEYDLYPYPFVVISSPYQQTNEIGEFEITVSYLNEFIDEFRFNLDIIPLINSSQMISVDLFYDSSCQNCESYIPIYASLEKNFSANFTFQQKNIDTNQSWLADYEELINETNSSIAPALVIRSDDDVIKIVKEDNITESATFLSNALHQYVKKIDPRPNNDNIINTPFGPIDLTAWSLPLLTIILGGIDSFNPCAFFILIFLLNLLIYAKSRKRMILIGGIFIFFSGLLYMIFMFFMYELFRQLQTSGVTLLVITLAVGAIVLPMGLLNIKDFFFFKKGASLSIPDSKKPKIYKKMRGLVKNPKLGATILGTIVLAATVNFYELLCTLGLPFAFTKALTNFSVASDSMTYYFYIFLYNVVYVIPLFIIVLIFVITLGKRKLTEWHGQIMKLVSGIMLTLFGIIFITDYKMLENVLTPVLLLLISLGATAVIAFLYKRYVGIPQDTDT